MATLAGAMLGEKVTAPGDSIGACTTNVMEPHRAAPQALPGLSSNVALPRIIADKYRLERMLGEGGMGTIWEAFNLQLELPVAIKLLRPELRSAELAERLRREARVAARLVHPSIVRVFDVGESEAGEPYIVMELLKGESLAELLDRGWLSPVDAVRLLLPIAEALSVAHAAGVVHRDLKPDNVFVTRAARVALPKLLDFGIAKFEETESGCRRKVTLGGTLVGSPNYMSPEQVACWPDVDHRSDIWSFCVMLYETLSGQAPFSGETLRTLRNSISEDAPPALELVGIDPKLASIVRRGLEKDRDRRPASISAVGRALASWLVEQGVGDDMAGSSLSAKWLDSAWEYAEPRAAASVTSGQERSVTLVSPGLDELDLQRRWHWPTVLGSATAAGALVALGFGFAVDVPVLRISNAPTVVSFASTEQACRTTPVPSVTAATPVLALAPLETSADDWSSFSTERVAVKHWKPAMPAKTAQRTPPESKHSKTPAPPRAPF